MSKPLFREALVDLDALAQNIATLSGLTGPGLKMVVVKAKGYGHGAVPVARTAEEAGADWLGVVSIAEALELRAAGIALPILAWLHDPDASFDRAIEQQVDLGVSYLEQLERIAASPGVARVQLKVDTGLGRNGASPLEWQQLTSAAAAHQAAGRIMVTGVWSHLANAGGAADRAQIAAFDEAVAVASAAGLQPELLHIAATAGALRVPEARYGLVRLGIGVYGLSPFDDVTSADLGLRPALQLSAAIASVKRVAAGSGVSYAHDYRTASETTLVLVPLGYADGVPRHASGRGPVSINGTSYPISGRVAMDQVVVDVGDAAVAVGDRAILFGDPATGVPSAEDWALAADTINYEIVTRLGGRVEYRYRS